ncbi:MAG TPA: HPr(Ser) kinase/phosphatase [Gemmatimonadaceae bacterium]|nr:HPr(Ser) kinase/phosphatase [Gemmatimonadaceae bacterium]
MTDATGETFAVGRTGHHRLTVGRLYERLREPLLLEDLSGVGMEREVVSPDISSPGLVLSGFTERFVAKRLQVLGETEITYLYSLPVEDRRHNIRRFLTFPIPAVFVTKGQALPDGLEEEARAADVALFRSALKTNEFYNRAKPWLEEEFAPSTTVHGSLADVFGVGLLFVGRSGIGKSECVLDLVERGHRLVADDLVIVKRRGQHVLIGRGHELQRHYMEIRGVGLVDIPAIFGIRAVRQQKRIEVIVRLEEWAKDQVVERTGLDTELTDILGVDLPRITVPLNPGKNITVIAEVIAMNHLLRYSGIDPAERFNERLIKQMRASSEVRRYLQEDNE